MVYEPQIYTIYDLLIFQCKGLTEIQVEHCYKFFLFEYSRLGSCSSDNNKRNIQNLLKQKFKIYDDFDFNDQGSNYLLVM